MALVLPARSVEFSHVRALILDPSLSNRRLLHDILNDLHCRTVTGFALLDDAWGELRKGGINCMFLDWSNETDAPNILQMLRGPGSPERYVPVVVVASYSGIDDVTRARDCGATEFMLRPFSKEVVASRLRAIVRLPRLFVESETFFGPDRRRHHQQWSGLERRQRPHYADRRASHDPGYQGPERRLQPEGAPPPRATLRPLSPQGVVPMSTSQGSA
jgi:CheY-like chemotaxis protein